VIQKKKLNRNKQRQSFTTEKIVCLEKKKRTQKTKDKSIRASNGEGGIIFEGRTKTRTRGRGRKVGDPE